MPGKPPPKAREWGQTPRKNPPNLAKRKHWSPQNATVLCMRWPGSCGPCLSVPAHAAPYPSISSSHTPSLEQALIRTCLDRMQAWPLKTSIAALTPLLDTRPCVTCLPVQCDVFSCLPRHLRTEPCSKSQLRLLPARTPVQQGLFHSVQNTRQESHWSLAIDGDDQSTRKIFCLFKNGQTPSGSSSEPNPEPPLIQTTIDSNHLQV